MPARIWVTAHGQAYVAGIPESQVRQCSTCGNWHLTEECDNADCGKGLFWALRHPRQAWIAFFVRRYG